MTKIIAFSGRKQSGKSTSGEYVVELLKKFKPDCTYKIYSLADPLKQKVCMDILGLTYEQCYGTDEDKNTMSKIMWDDLPLNNIDTEKNNRSNIFLTAREVMEIFGTKFFRRLLGDVWINALLKEIKKDNVDYAIIVDVRFPNEVEGILEERGIVIRLMYDPYHSLSPSETALDKENFSWLKFTHIIDNTQMSQKEKNLEILSILSRQEII